MERKQKFTLRLQLRRLPVAIIFTIFLTLLYWQGIYGDFVLDDRTFFIENDVLPQLKTWDVKGLLSGSNYWGDLLPIRDFIYILEYNLFGLNTAGYHLVSLGLYVLICMLVYMFLLKIYSDGTGAGPSNPSLSAFFAALIFAAYPVHVEPVAYITGQKDLLFSLFTLAAMNVFWIFFNSPDKKKSLMLFGIALYYAALLSKPTAIMLSILAPLLYFLSDYKPIPPAGPSNQKRKGTDRRKALAVWGLVNIPALWWILTYLRIGGQYWGGTADITRLQWPERLMVALKSLGAHTALALRPYPLSFGYPFNPSVAFDGNLIIGVFTLSAVALALFIFRRDRIIIFAVCLYIFSLAPVLQLQGSLNNESIYDRYLFIPVLGVAILLERTLNSLTLARGRYLKTYLTAAVGVIIVLALLTASYIPSFNSDIAVTKNSYEKFPEWSSSPFNYVYSLIEGRRLDEAYAITLREKGLESPLWVRSYFLGWIFLERGMAAEAISELKTSTYLAMSGGYFPYPAVPLARAYIAAGKEVEAAGLLQEVLKSPLYQPLEEYRARKLLDNIKLRRNQ